MLHLFRRHYPPCPYTSRRYRRCACPIWVQGSLRGEWVKKSLNLTSWEAASDLVTAWTASGEIGVVKPETPTVEEAVSRFFTDCEARNLRQPTIKKLRNLLDKRLVPWCESRGIRNLKQLDVDALRRFRETWPDSPISAYKNLERLRSFFRFCHQAGWMKTNPVLGVKPPKVDQTPTLPLSEEDVKKLIDACDRYSAKGIYNSGNRDRLRTMVLLLRHSGLRIRDAATLRKERVKDGKLFLYTAKTGTPVWLPLKPEVIDAFDTVKSQNPEYVFWSGNGDAKTTVADWQRSFRKLCKLAGVEGHFHMLRDSFACSLLSPNVQMRPLRNV